MPVKPPEVRSTPNYHRRGGETDPVPAQPQPELDATGLSREQLKNRERRDQRWGFDICPKQPATAENPDRPWEIIDARYMDPVRCTDLPPEMKQAVETLVARNIEDDRSRPEDGQRRAVAIEEQWDRWAIERYYLTEEAEENRQQAERHRNSAEQARARLGALQAENDGFQRLNGAKVEESIQLQGAAEQLAEIRHERHQARQRHQQLVKDRLELNQASGEWAQVRNELNAPSLGRRLKRLVNKDTRRRDQARLAEAWGQINLSDRKLGDNRDQDQQNRHQLKTWRDQRQQIVEQLAANYNIRSTDELTDRVDTLEPISQHNSELKQKLEDETKATESHNNSFWSHYQAGATAENEIEDLDREAEKELIAAARSPGRTGFLTRRAMSEFMHGGISFDANGQSVVESTGDWKPPARAPAGVKTAADHRRLCAETMVPPNFYSFPTTAAEKALIIAPDLRDYHGNEITLNPEDRQGRELVQYEQTPFDYKHEAIPNYDQLPKSLAVHCADLDQGYYHDLTILKQSLLANNRDRRNNPERLDNAMALVEEDCRRREIDRYLTLKELEGLRQESQGNYGRVLNLQGRQEALDRELRQLANSEDGQKLRHYKELEARVVRAKRLGGKLGQLQAQRTELDRDLEQLQANHDLWRDAHQQLEPTWVRNPLRKLGLSRSDTKHRLQQEREQATQRLTDIQGDQLGHAARRDDYHQAIVRLEANPQLQGLTEAERQLADSGPGHEQAQRRQSSLVEQLKVCQAEITARKARLDSDQSRISPVETRANEIWQEIQAFFDACGREQNNVQNLLSTRVDKFSEISRENRRPIITNGQSWTNEWNEMAGCLSADHYRRQQAAQLVGLNPKTMTRALQTT